MIKKYPTAKVNKLVENEDLREFIRQFLSPCKSRTKNKKCIGCECDIDAIIREVIFYWVTEE